MTSALAQADAFGKWPHLHSHEVNERLIPMVYLSDRTRLLAATGSPKAAELLDKADDLDEAVAKDPST